MKRIFSALMIFAMFLGYCQKIELSDQSSYAFKKGKDYYKLNESSKIFKNEDALKYLAKAKTNRTVGYVLGGIGGFGIGFGLVSALSAKEETVYLYGGTAVTQKKSGMWGYALVGAGVALASIPFYIGAKKNVKKAIDAENSADDFAKSNEFSVYGTGTGIGLAYRF